jgi:hypothetical protein
MRTTIWKTALIAGAAALIFGSGLMVGANKFGKPKSILHVVTISWKDGTTAAQKKAALSGVETMAGEIPGVKNVWTKGIKVQGEGFSDAFVMEFQDQKSFDAYADAPSHKEWEKIYLPIRGRSTTHDITNE